MSPDSTHPDSSATRKRFSWPMRFFLCFFLFFMTFRSLSILVPWNDWRRELDMAPWPRRLPTPAEREQLRIENPDADHDPAVAEIWLSVDSIWEYFRPWPGPAVRKKIDSPEALGKFAYCWLCSRLEFLERVAGVNEEWPMFSPGVSKYKYVTRARLVYLDGSERIVRQLSDPEDLTSYAHWFQEKRLDYETKVKANRRYLEENLGYCNLLAHRYPEHNGSPLARIFLFQVRYDFPPPGVDAREFLRQQTGPPADQISPDYFRYDVCERKGTYLNEED